MVLLCIFGVVVIGIIVLKVYTYSNLVKDPIFAVYSVTITTFILSRFGLGWLYLRARSRIVTGEAAEQLYYEPTVAIIVPAYNEPDIAATIRACVSVDYPKGKLKVVVVDDKSTDNTLELIYRAQIDLEDDEFITVIPLVVNGGKRHALAAGYAALEPEDGEICVFIDSDSQVTAEGVTKLVAYFRDATVGAVAGHTDVANRQTNILTRMQAMQYYIAFRIYKSAEALFGCVTCCSGCFSGYRRSALEPILDPWLKQSFCGMLSTYGDDRSLTNFLLPDWRILYAPDAQAYTNVPEHLRQLLKQQLRWKKSWLRECTRAAKVMWRKHPIMVALFYLGFILPLLAPQVVFRAMVVQPYFINELPVWYFGGVAAMAVMYGIYYRAHQSEKRWYQGIFFTLFYTVILVWQLPYAMATIRDSKWGTR